MIHSLSGGVIADDTIFIFAKVELDGTPYWFRSPFPEIKVGDRVLVPFGKAGIPREGTVVKVEAANAGCAPFPLNRIKDIYRIL